MAELAPSLPAFPLSRLDTPPTPSGLFEPGNQENRKNGGAYPLASRFPAFQIESPLKPPAAFGDGRSLRAVFGYAPRRPRAPKPHFSPASLRNFLPIQPIQPPAQAADKFQPG